jgi:hypothetical protein
MDRKVEKKKKKLVEFGRHLGIIAQLMNPGFQKMPVHLFTP